MTIEEEQFLNTIDSAFHGNGVIVAGYDRLRLATRLLIDGRLDLVFQGDGYMVVKPTGSELRKPRKKAS